MNNCECFKESLSAQARYLVRDRPVCYDTSPPNGFCDNTRYALLKSHSLKSSERQMAMNIQGLSVLDIKSHFIT